MTNELKQRLVGVAVITAIAAIFLPMLFDDPVHESGKAVNEIVIPEPPEIAEPEIIPPVTASPQIYPLSSTPEGGLSEDEIAGTNGELGETGVNNTLAPNELIDEAEADVKAAKRMTEEELFTLNDKKARESILTGKAADISVAKVNQDKKPGEKKANDNVLVSAKAKDTLDAESKVKNKLEADKQAKLEVLKRVRDKLAADKKTQDKMAVASKLNEKLEMDRSIKAQLDDDKKALDKYAKEQADYRKLAAKKNQEKELADKKAVAKLAIETKNVAKQQALDDKAAVAKIAADKQAAAKAITNTPVNVRWYIRLGSFGQEANAITLRDKLRKQGYPAVVDTINSAGKGKLYRLRVGPELSKAVAEKTRQKMDAQNNSKSILELQ
ncbi:MAG: hypothetical protein HOP02_06035 [Methylococcaceae bacterium]|nr:hypothetical protein [Methylococcaceae bacterium]